MAEQALERQGRSVHSIKMENDKAKDLLWRNWRAVQALADELLHRVEIDGDEAERIIATALGIRKSA